MDFRANGDVKNDLTIDYTSQNVVPKTCLPSGLQCEAISSAQCADTGSTCTCVITGKDIDTGTDTYTVAGNTVAINSASTGSTTTMEFCVSGSALTGRGRRPDTNDLLYYHLSR